MNDDAARRDPCYSSRARLQLGFKSFLFHGLFYAVGTGVVMALLYLFVWQQVGRPTTLKFVTFQFLTGFWIAMLGAVLLYPAYRYLAERWHGVSARGKFACEDHDERPPHGVRTSRPLRDRS